MPYNAELAARIRTVITPIAQEKKMFGGLGFLMGGNMVVGVHQDYLIVRVGAEQYAAALKKQGAKPFDITGRAMTGWVMVSQEGCHTKKALENWISTAMEFVATLPPK